MALFNRNKADKPVLPEIEKYYDAEKRERAGLAWFLAVASIAAIALLIIGLFFGGRWIYRKTTGSNNKTGVSISETTNTGISNKTKSDTKDKTDNSPKPQAPSTTPAKPSTPAPSTPSPAPVTPPAATAPSSKLASTGPANTVAIFIVSVLGFAGLHNLLSRSRQSN